ncbi:MAG: type II toxin-antitoxin system RelE/ParE family toxin [Anaerolineae bacterium]
MSRPGKKWKRLEGTDGLVRLRVGDYRVLYEVMDEEVHVLLVIHQRDLERWLRRL